MADAYDEPTWGADLGTPSAGAGRHQQPDPSANKPAADYPTGQISFPVVAPNNPAPVVAPYVPPYVAPHVANPWAPPPAGMAYPPVVVPAPVPPIATPYPPPAVGMPVIPPPAPGYGGYQPVAPKDTFVTRLVERGIRGELFRQPWFHNLRATQPDVFVYVSYGVAVLVTLLVSLIPSSFVATLLTDALWAALAYLYFALGTKLAHQFLLWGICVAGGVVMLLRVWSVISLMSIDSSLLRYTGRFVEPTGLLALDLVLDVAGGVLLAFVGLQVHREMAKLSRP